MTLGTELAEHRYPDPPRRIRVPGCRRDLDRHGYWLCAALRRNRHDNPFTRVSIALSTESPQGRRNPGIRCAATLLAASPGNRRKSPGSALWDRLGSLPRVRQLETWVRQLCAKGQMRRSHPQGRRRRDERPVINPPNINAPGTRSNSISLSGRPRRTLSPECQQPSRQSVSNPVKDPVRNPPTAGQAQRPRTRTPPPRRRHPKEENVEMTLC